MIRPHSHLRDYQKYIQTHVVEAWKSHKSIMLQMPTGTGKTHLLASIIYDSLKENGKRYVWMWHTAANWWSRLRKPWNDTVFQASRRRTEG